MEGTPRRFSDLHLQISAEETSTVWDCSDWYHEAPGSLTNMMGSNAYGVEPSRRGLCSWGQMNVNMV